MQVGSATQLIANRKPFMILGGGLGNSSVYSVSKIERIFPKLQQVGLNTVLIHAYLDLLEPKEGTFDFTLTDKVIDQTRKNDLKIVFLWFGIWENRMCHYVPEWFKKEYKKYPRAYTKIGVPFEVANALSDNVFNAESKVFSRWISYITKIKKQERTVIMIPIENKIWMLEDRRDYMEITNELTVQ